MKEQFLKRMQRYLQDEYEDYKKTLNEKAYRGLRINLLKEERKLLEKTFSLSPSPFCKEGYYMNDVVSGKHPFHLQGLFYMQEPSASSVVSILDIQEKDWVLDLCSAPGGKSSQIASHLKHSGLLVSNEVVHQRAQVLLSNMERMGVSENIITNSDVTTVCHEMKGCFDKVLVDAPCSGEGMFKIHEKAIDDWSEEHVQACALRQQAILNDAYLALKKEGTLVYSTCTYAIEENEATIAAFLEVHKDMELLDCNVDFGRNGLICEGVDEQKVRRIFPMDKGEGHFVAKMKRNSENDCVKLKSLENKKMADCVIDFLESQLTQLPPYLYEQNGKVYARFSPFIQLKKMKVIRQGILCGEIIKNRFEPHHHFYMAAALDDIRKGVVDLNEEECHIFLSGNVINRSIPKGFVGLSYAGHLIGFGKSDGKIIKNKYPKGLRIH